ncbi:MAG: thymidine kinase [Chloroflexi bacterium]|nr:thymidine kinase [Chloroflexota bacterium]
MRHTHGLVEVIAGPMFSGKTEELIRRLRRAVIARQKVQVFKPRLDDRYSVDHVASHNGEQFEAQPVASAEELAAHVQPDTTVVGIDEAQFFDAALIPLVQGLAQRGVRVILSGLDMDFRGEPFGIMPALLAQADRVDKLTAICMVCGNPATRSQRLIDGRPAHYDEPVVMVGAAEMYEPRCRAHHQVPGHPALPQEDDSHARAGLS